MATSVVALFGFRRSAKEGVLVSITVDGEHINAQRAKFISNPARRSTHEGGMGESWWLANLSLDDGSVIQLETKVGVRGRGQDSERTQSHIYVVDSESPVQEVSVRKVGFHNYPLLKGHLRTISAQSLQDQTDNMIEGHLDED